MSIQAVRSFIELIHLNRALRMRIQSIPRDALATERVVGLAERYGYRFTAEELQTVLQSPRELSDAELESAAGGVADRATLDLLLHSLAAASREQV